MLTAFIYNGEIHVRAVPGKHLFHSTMVHEVVNRGDIFALRLRDQVLTIVPGKAEVEHIKLEVPAMNATKPPSKLKQLQLDLQARVTKKERQNVL